MIGDSDADIDAGRNAVCRTARLVVDNQATNGNADVVGFSLIEVIRKVLQWEGSSDRKSPKPDYRETGGVGHQKL